MRTVCTHAALRAESARKGWRGWSLRSAAASSCVFGGEVRPHADVRLTQPKDVMGVVGIRRSPPAP